MKLNGRRESSNVEDRRGGGSRGTSKAGLGLGGIILIAVGAILFKKSYISTIVHVFSDTTAVVLIVIGLLNAARLLLFKRSNRQPGSRPPF